MGNLSVIIPTLNAGAGLRRSLPPLAAFDGLEPADIFITSGAVLTTDAAPEGAFRLDEVADVAVVPGSAEGGKCERCWKILPEVETATVPVCGRCSDAVSARGMTTS